MTDLSEIIARLERATEGSRELDAVICVSARVGYPSACPWVETNFPAWKATHNGRVVAVHSDGSPGPHWDVPRCTTSRDASHGLIPSGLIEVCIETVDFGDHAQVSISWGTTQPFDRRSVIAEGKTVPLATSGAALKALAADTSAQGVRDA